MMDKNKTDSQLQFEEAWRRWLDHAPRVSDQDAARSIAKRIELPHSSIYTWIPAGAVAALLLILAFSFPWIQGWYGSHNLQLVIPEGTPVELQPYEVLMWLDEQTPLYMNYQMADVAVDGEAR